VTEVNQDGSIRVQYSDGSGVKTIPEDFVSRRVRSKDLPCCDVGDQLVSSLDAMKVAHSGLIRAHVDLIASYKTALRGLTANENEHKFFKAEGLVCAAGSTALLLAGGPITAAVFGISAAVMKYKGDERRGRFDDVVQGNVTCALTGFIGSTEAFVKCCDNVGATLSALVDSQGLSEAQKTVTQCLQGNTSYQSIMHFATVGGLYAASTSAPVLGMMNSIFNAAVVPGAAQVGIELAEKSIKFTSLHLGYSQHIADGIEIAGNAMGGADKAAKVAQWTTAKSLANVASNAAVVLNGITLVFAAIDMVNAGTPCELKLVLEKDLVLRTDNLGKLKSAAC